jgi:16S rRNA (guanine527-N7)-methyltransferase
VIAADAVRGRLAALGADPLAAEPLARVLALQAHDPAASTTVRDPAAALDVHVADSLVALALPAVAGARSIADLGAGAGWPGLALAAALPASHVALVESALRHCRYLERAVEAAGLANAEVVHARAEDWPAGVGVHDLVTARALAPLAVVLEYAAPLLAEGGHVVAWKAAPDEAERAAGAAAAAELGLVATEVRRVQPFPAARERTLHVFRKAAPTPPRFPRRPGMAVKRPLGGARPGGDPPPGALASTP